MQMWRSRTNRLQLLPVEIITHILSYTHQYHMVTMWVCTLWADIVRSSDRSGCASHICNVAEIHGNTKLLLWFANYNRKIGNTICKSLLRAYYSGKIDRHDLCAVLYNKKIQRFSHSGYSVLNLVVYHRDDQVFHMLYDTQYFDETCGLVNYSKSDLTWLMSEGVKLTEDLAWEMVSNSRDNMAYWVFSQCETIKNGAEFQSAAPYLQLNSLKIVLDAGLRLIIVIDYEFMNEHVKRGDVLETLKLLLEYHDWKFHKEYLLGSFRDDDACCDYINALYPNELETREM
jgi:hypothetical protein